MVYLSANGEVIGQFDVKELPAVLAAGKVPRDAFFWREGMPDWRPLSELVPPPLRGPGVPVPRRKIEPAVLAPVSAVVGGPKPKLKLDPSVAGSRPGRQPFVPRPRPLAVRAVAAVPSDEADPAPRPSPSAAVSPSPEVVSEPSPRLQSATVEARKVLPAEPRPAAGPGAAAVEPTVPGNTPAEIPPAATPQALPFAAGKRPPFMARYRPETTPAEASGPLPDTPGAGPLPVPPLSPRRGRWLVRAALLLLVPVLLGAIAWWFLFAPHPVVTGEVRVPAPDGGLAPAAGAAVFVVPQEELAISWRTRLETARSRAAEFDELLVQARAAHREKDLVLELAARVSEVADEYNMPDAAQLRAERDAIQREEQSAREEIERITREQQAVSDFAAFLTAPPAATLQVATDESGIFRLPVPEATEGLALLVVSARPGDDKTEVHGWLVPLGLVLGRTEPWRFSPEDALDADRIREIAAAAP